MLYCGVFLNNAELNVKEVGGSGQCSEFTSVCCWLTLKSTSAARSEENAFHSVAGRAATYGAKPSPRQAGKAVVNTFIVDVYLTPVMSVFEGAPSTC